MDFDEWLEIDAYEAMPTGAGDVAVDRYIPPKHRLAIRLFDTEYEVGELTLELPSNPREVTEKLRKFARHPMTLVMHPTRGVLNVGVVTGGPDVDWRPYIGAIHHQLEGTCEILREKIRNCGSAGDPHPFWCDHPMPFGPALVLGGAPGEVEPEELDIDPAICIEEDWETLPERLGAVMDHHAPDEADETYLARGLATALKTLDPIDTKYIDHVECVAIWQSIGDQLFEPDDAA